MLCQYGVKSLSAVTPKIRQYSAERYQQYVTFTGHSVVFKVKSSLTSVTQHRAILCTYIRYAASCDLRSFQVAVTSAGTSSMSPGGAPIADRTAVLYAVLALLLLYACSQFVVFCMHEWQAVRLGQVQIVQVASAVRCC